MQSLRRAYFQTGSALAAAILITSIGAPAQAAPSAPPPDNPVTHYAQPRGTATESVTPLAADPLPFPVTAGITDDGLGIWVYADTASSNNWNLTIYDPLGNAVAGMEFVKPRVRAQYPITGGGGWHDVYLTNYLLNKEVYVDSFDIQGSIERNFGGSRFETSAAISNDSFPHGVPVAYIADGLNFPDALSGAAAAGHLGGPVLLTRSTLLPAAIKTELTHLAPAKIVVLGGTGAVSNDVKNALVPYTTGTVTRIGGSTRYDTSARISAAAFSPGVPVAYIANGLNFPDALSGAAAAGKKGGPVLLTPPDALPSVIVTELQRLKPAKIVVLGGSDVVSPAVMTKLGAYTSGSVTRLAGQTRFDTAVAVSAATYSPGVPVVFLANAFNFPDALSGAAAAGMRGGPVLLTRAGYLEPSVKTELDRLNPRRIVVLGGPDVINQMMVGMDLPQYVLPVVQRTGGSYVNGTVGTAGPSISNVVITSNSLSVTVNFDYVQPAGWWDPVFVGIYPGTPADYPYNDLSVLGDYGLNDDWSAWMWMPQDATKGHASQSFPVSRTGPLTVMLFGSNSCDCAGGTEFFVGRDFAAVP